MSKGNSVEIHNPGNEIDIKELFVFLSVDDQGCKGVCASFLPNFGSTPMISANYSFVEKMKTLAKQLSKETGMSIELYRFVRDEKPMWQTFSHTTRDIMEPRK
jgi:hypothetical protein